MPKTFKDQVLIEVDRVDSDGDFFPREVMAKAVADVQKRLEAGSPLLIMQNFYHECEATQGLVTVIRMDGNKVVIDGAILDTEAGLQVQIAIDEVEKARERGESLEDPIGYAMEGEGVFELDPETGVARWSSLQITTVAAVERDEKSK